MDAGTRDTIPMITERRELMIIEEGSVVPLLLPRT